MESPEEKRVGEARVGPVDRMEEVIECRGVSAEVSHYITSDNWCNQLLHCVYYTMHQIH